MKHSIFNKVNNSYFWNLWPANQWLFGCISIDIWFKNEWGFWEISPSSANDKTYYCLNLYLGPVNISYTYMSD